MNAEEFEQEMKARLVPNFGERYGTVVRRDDLLVKALALGLDPDPRVAFHASYALEHAVLSDPDAFIPHHAQFVDNYLAVVSPGAHRHYSKMMWHLLRHGSLRLSPQQAERVAEATFDRLIEPGTRPGVKVWAMDILERLAVGQPWIAEQLYDTVQFLMENGSAGIRSRGLKLCRRLKAEK